MRGKSLHKKRLVYLGLVTFTPVPPKRPVPKIDNALCNCIKDSPWKWDTPFGQSLSTLRPKCTRFKACIYWSRDCSDWISDAGLAAREIELEIFSGVRTSDGLHLIFHFVDEPLTKTCDKITTRTTRMGKLSQIFFPEVGTPEQHGKMINIHFPCIDVPLFLRQAFSDH